jgi:hypothetical protein
VAADVTDWAADATAPRSTLADPADVAVAAEVLAVAVPTGAEGVAAGAGAVLVADALEVAGAAAVEVVGAAAVEVVGAAAVEVVGAAAVEVVGAAAAEVAAGTEPVACSGAEVTSPEVCVSAAVTAGLAAGVPGSTVGGAVTATDPGAGFTVEGPTVDARACRAVSSKASIIPAATIATCTARRATCRNTGRDTTAPLLSGPSMQGRPEARDKRLPQLPASTRPQTCAAEKVGWRDLRRLRLAGEIVRRRR